MKKIISVLLSCTLLFSALVLPSSAANEVQVGGFQGFENFTGSTNTNFSIVEGTAGGTVYSGTKALKVAYHTGTIAYDLSAPTGYLYTVGEWYKVSVWVKPETGVTGSTNVNLSENNASSPWNSTNLKVDHRFLTITSSTAAEWKEYTFTFQAQRTCYGLWIDGGGSSTFYFDNLKIEKVSAESLRQAEVENAFTFNGTAIRTEGKQALRFKTTVDENILAENALTGNQGGTVSRPVGFIPRRPLRRLLRLRQSACERPG